jgi:aconitate hydratase
MTGASRTSDRLDRKPGEHSTASTSRALVDPLYGRWAKRTARGRERLGRPLTYAEKVLMNHLRDPAGNVQRGDYADFDPDRVALQDALAQIVALQLLAAGLNDVSVPTTVHCDHLIQAKTTGVSDLQAAVETNAEVYEFLRTFCARFGVGFWAPGSGIIHQVVLEHYAFPGGMMIGTDSHTPNAGGLGMVAVGVGGGDAIDVMTGQAFNVRWPKVIGVRLTGELDGWVSPKDVILHVSGLLTVSGGTGSIVEYFGPGADTISATGKATICNMGAEVGATTSLFPFDRHIGDYLGATGRGAIAEAAGAISDQLRCDPEVESDPGRYFDRVIDVDLSTLTPLINGPDTPDLSHRVSDVGAWAADNGIPLEVSAALIGSCTNSSYEDMTRVASIARQASRYGLRTKAKLFVTPGSEQVRATLARDGLLDDLQSIGATVLANACGPCIGQWDRPVADRQQPNTIVTSFNRNFPRRNDGDTHTKAFVTSPDMVLLYALSGTLGFDPLSEELSTDSGRRVCLDAPAGEHLPGRGFDPGTVAFVAPPDDRSEVDVVVSPDSVRLQRFAAFPPWDGHEFLDLPVLVKARGKCTTDQISAAGQWLRYRGHLERISGNLFLGVVNAFSGGIGVGKDPTDGLERPFPEIARRLAEGGHRWCVVGDENYGEGSSREHAAMEPRYRGGAAILARSFARIHETNLKKQGLLPLTFMDPGIYDLIEEDDRISVLGLSALKPGVPVRCRLAAPSGLTREFECAHTFSLDQLEWFRAGSALNVISARQRQAGAVI